MVLNTIVLLKLKVRLMNYCVRGICVQVCLKACVQIIKDYCQQNGEWYVCELQIATNIIVFPLIQNANLAIILYIYNILSVKNGCGGVKLFLCLIVCGVN